jgi:Protein of unknown function (DUF3105)
MTALERVSIVVASLAIAVAVIILLSGGPLTGGDSPRITGPTSDIGTQYRDLGDGTLSPGARPPRYDSQPPTSGPHVPVAVRRDGVTLSDNQLLQALAVGDVVVMYGTRSSSRALRAVAAAVATPFTPALAAAGQAVILAHRAGTQGLLGVAWTRLVHVRSAADPQLRSFILYWLGRGAARPVP